MKLGMLGAGYVGLVSAACFSDFGHDVTCIDKDIEKIEALKKGKVPIYEPGLQALINKNRSSGRLKFENNLVKVKDLLDVLFIAVDTPSRRGDGRAELSSLLNAAKQIISVFQNGITIVIKSTCPIGTNRDLDSFLNNSQSKKKFDIVSNPEFLREGSAINDFMRPDRIILGASTDKVKGLMREIYKPLYLRDFPILYTDPETAETIKYASNAFLATKISFINEIANLCEKTGADVKIVAKGMGLDNRIGDKFLHAGPGYGGSCFPKDMQALVAAGKEYNIPMKIVQNVIQVNTDTKLRMVHKIINIHGGCVEGKIITFFGVTFKPNTGDMREAPSLTIIPELQLKNAIIRVVDPKGVIEGEKLLQAVSWFENPYEAAAGSDLIVTLTEWNEFRALDLLKLANNMRSPRMVDLRNIYSKDEVLTKGFTHYDGVGRGALKN